MFPHRTVAKTLSLVEIYAGIDSLYLHPDPGSEVQVPSELTLAATLVRNALQNRQTYGIPVDLHLVVSLRRFTDPAAVAVFRRATHEDAVLTEILLSIAASLEALPMRTLFADEIRFLKTI